MLFSLKVGELYLICLSRAGTFKGPCCHLGCGLFIGLVLCLALPSSFLALQSGMAPRREASDSLKINSQTRLLEALTDVCNQVCAVRCVVFRAHGSPKSFSSVQRLLFSMRVGAGRQIVLGQVGEEMEGCPWSYFGDSPWCD